ncbi:MAG: hypothetical protein JOY90_05525, partial [Bradyrhizobium sp.]|uniref:hypothetical protein n=1 Tax=Bradyrhizobium sp. TaxID=376 RepID=UPI001DB29CC9
PAIPADRLRDEDEGATASHCARLIHQRAAASTNNKSRAMSRGRHRHQILVAQREVETSVRASSFHHDLSDRMEAPVYDLRILFATLLFLPACLPAKAQEGNVEVGRGVICDSADQVRRFVALRSAGKAPDAALQTVNEDIKDAGSCGFSLVMFTSADPIAEMSVQGRPVSIVKITVHAFATGSAWTQVSPAVRYTAEPEKGRLT